MKDKLRKIVVTGAAGDNLVPIKDGVIMTVRPDELTKLTTQFECGLCRRCFRLSRWVRGGGPAMRRRLERAIQRIERGHMVRYRGDCSRALVG